METFIASFLSFFLLIVIIGIPAIALFWLADYMEKILEALQDILKASRELTK